LIPILLTVAALATPSKFQDRMGSGINEVNEYYVNNNTNTSIGIRLNFWHRAAQAIADRPLLGHGVGSWQQQFLRLVEPTTKGANPHNNPHQEYLQMGVQLGLGGIGLLIAFIVYLAKDANPMATPLRFATQSLALVFAVACLFNYSLFDALIGDYFCLLFGILFACGQNAALGETPDLAQMPLKI
jgi:O-antigen ligase